MSRYEADLTIAGVAAKTGVSVATLRAWERRYGFPSPTRLPGGHRRYSEHDVASIRRVLAERAGGRLLDAAVAIVAAPDADLDETIFAGLRRRRPDLVPQVISRSGMLAISRAIEDECTARGERSHLVAAFQRAELYRSARRHRWSSLSRPAASTIVFADFHRTRTTAAGVHEVAIPSGAPQEREWAVICDGPRSSAALAGWERPDGRFEAVWTVDPTSVRDASELARSLAARHAPSLTVAPLPPSAPARDDDAVGRAVAVANRAVAYLDASTRYEEVRRLRS
jgi:DNA-binding transcriptional MerR regulator